MKNIMNERLQLLATFKVVFSERTLVDAADVLGCSQSSVSKQLQKLREWFQDELFVRTGGGMQATAKAESLITRVESILSQLEELNESTHFDPQQLSGAFVIETTDEICRMISTPLLRTLQHQSPGVRLSVRRLARDYAIRELESGRVDVAIGVNWSAPEQLIQKRLYSEHFVVVMGAGHRLANKKLTVKNYAEALHLMVAPLDSGRGIIDDALEKLQFKRRLVATVPGFAEITPELLADDFLVTLPSQVARVLAREATIKTKPLPFELPAYNYYMFWHRRFSGDPRHRWLRERAEQALVDAV